MAGTPSFGVTRDEGCQAQPREWQTKRPEQPLSYKVWCRRDSPEKERVHGFTQNARVFADRDGGGDCPHLDCACLLDNGDPACAEAGPRDRGIQLDIDGVAAS